MLDRLIMWSINHLMIPLVHAFLDGAERGFKRR